MKYPKRAVKKPAFSYQRSVKMKKNEIYRKHVTYVIFCIICCKLIAEG